MPKSFVPRNAATFAVVPRRALYKGLAVLLSALFVFSFGPSAFQAAPAQAQSTPPNIVVFLIDDFDEASFNQLLAANKLPRIKSLLIDHGTRFTNSFVTDSSCCPSRATFLTGKYPHNHGVRNVTGDEGGTLDLMRSTPRISLRG